MASTAPTLWNHRCELLRAVNRHRPDRVREGWRSSVDRLLLSSSPIRRASALRSVVCVSSSLLDLLSFGMTFIPQMSSEVKQCLRFFHGCFLRTHPAAPVIATKCVVLGPPRLLRTARRRGGSGPCGTPNFKIKRAPFGVRIVRVAPCTIIHLHFSLFVACPPYQG